MKWGSFGAGDGQFNNALAVAEDGAGNVYVADTGNDRIQKFDSTGSFLTSIVSAEGLFNNPACGGGQFGQRLCGEPGTPYREV